jgi:hypothetical protein
MHRCIVRRLSQAFIMALSQAEKREMVLATRESAWNMIDDLKHMRAVIAKPVPTRSDIRHVSNLVRRLLIDKDGDLRRIAPPRLSKQLEFLAPDVRRAMKERERTPVFLDSVGVSGIFGTTLARIVIPLRNFPYPPDLPQLPWRFNSQARGFSFEVTGWRGEGEDAPRTIILKQDSFLSQGVLYFDGKWIKRRDIIKYVANVAGGVHSDQPTEISEKLLHKIRQIVLLSQESESESRGVSGLRLS